METEEIYSIAIYPPILSRFAVQWSQDNHISILTEKGIHIFEMIPSPMSPYSTIRFSRSFIYPPAVSAQSVANKIVSKVWSLQRQELYSFMMRESLTSKIATAKEMVPKIVDLAWSPQNLVHPSKCLLAVLTSAGTVTVAYKLSTEWYPAYDLTTMRYNTLEEEMNRVSMNSQNYSELCATLKRNIKALQASCFIWSQLFVNFAYFAVAYHNGDIVIYKVSEIVNFNEIPVPRNVGTVKLNEETEINALHWIVNDANEHTIILGYSDGRIYGLRVWSNSEIVETKSIDKYYDYKDRNPVSAIRTFPANNSKDNRKVVLSKGSFLFLLRFSVKGVLKDIRHIQLNGVVSGIISISEDDALIVTENGCMRIIDTREADSIEIEVKDKLSQSQSRMRYLGVAHSPGRVLFVNVTSPNCIYDHLVIKEPSKIYMFRLKDERWDPLTVLKEKKYQRFGQLWDCLEVLRMKATKTTEIGMLFPTIPSDLKSLSINELRTAMWMSIIIEICEKKRVVEGIGNIAGEISEAQPLILLHTACDYLTHFENKRALLQEQQLSINLLRSYLKAYLAEEKMEEESSPLSKRIKDVLQKTSRLESDDIESCNLCGETLNNVAWKVTKCSRGHILPRCAITLLQITTARYGICPICGLIFHSSIDEEFSETRCLFCDVPALQENRTLSSKSHIPKKRSLSKGNYPAEVTEDHEVDEV